MKGNNNAKMFFGGIVAFLVVAAFNFVYGWNGPTAAAPEGNAPAPINVGEFSQIKAGGIRVNTGKNATNQPEGGLYSFGSLSGLGFTTRDGAQDKLWQWYAAKYSSAESSVRLWDAVTGTDVFAVTQSGKVKIPGGNPQNGYVLAADDNTGLASWRSINDLVPTTGGGNKNLPDWVENPSGPNKVPVADVGGNVTWQIMQQGGGGIAGVSKIKAGTGITIDPSSGTGEVMISATGVGNASAPSFKGAWCGFGSRYGSPTGEKNKSGAVGTGGIGSGYELCGTSDPAESCSSGFTRAEFRDTANSGNIHYYYTCINNSGASPATSAGTSQPTVYAAPVIKSGILQMGSWSEAAGCSDEAGTYCKWNGNTIKTSRITINFSGTKFAGTPAVFVMSGTDTISPIDLAVTSVSASGFTVMARGYPTKVRNWVNPADDNLIVRWVAISEEK